MAEPTKQRPGDQPLPHGGRECVQDALIQEIRARKELGCQRYGSPLMTHNGRSAIRDAREEALDLTVYLMQVELELRDLLAERDQLAAALADQRGARRIAAESADRLRDVLCEALGHDDENPGDDVLVAELRARFGKSGPEPTRWRDFITSAEAIRDQLIAAAREDTT